jgi:hypothetical protein
MVGCNDILLNWLDGKRHERVGGWDREKLPNELRRKRVEEKKAISFDTI